MITLYGYPRSRSLRIAWTLEELELDYACECVDLASGVGRQEAHLRRHPFGKVPVLVDDGLTLFESTTIARYLAERYQPGRLLPIEVGERARVDQWLSFATTELEQPLWTMAKHRFALPEAQRVPAILPTAQWELEQALKALARRFDGEEWLFGETFSLADVFIGHTLEWARAFEQPLPAGLDAYRQRCLARPAVVAAIARERDAQARLG